MNIYTKVPHAEYKKLIERVGTLEKENAMLKAELKKANAKAVVKNVENKVEKTETKKGGNKE